MSRPPSPDAKPGSLFQCPAVVLAMCLGIFIAAFVAVRCWRQHAEAIHVYVVCEAFAVEGKILDRACLAFMVTRWLTTFMLLSHASKYMIC